MSAANKAKQLKNMKSILIFILIYLFSSISLSIASPMEKSACLKKVGVLKLPREQVAEYDGIWGLFQKNAELQDNSVQGITLDKLINAILFNLEFLCNTIDGIPFDELSDYVTVNLAEKGEEKFRQELLNLGKNEGQIAVWFEFAKFAIAKRHRSLDPEKITRSIHLAHPFLESYLELAEKINRKEGKSNAVQEAQNLIDQIQKFFETDPYMAQAIHENSQIPYADWDENYGGS